MIRLATHSQLEDRDSRASLQPVVVCMEADSREQNKAHSAPGYSVSDHAEGYGQNANKQSDECAAEIMDALFHVFGIMRATRVFHRHL